MKIKKSNKKFNQIFKNENFCINLSTNNKKIFSLLENCLDFNDKISSIKRLTINFSIDEEINNNSSKPKIYTPPAISDSNNWQATICKSIADVKINLKSKTINAVIFDFQESLKEHLLYFTFFKPLRIILANQGLYCLHSSAVSKNDRCILICGPQNTGKSTTAFLFSKIGYGILCDDDCFIKTKNGKALVYPFPTKMGVNDNFIKKHSAVKKLLIKNYRYGTKKRLSLKKIYESSKLDYKEKIILLPRYSDKEKFSIKTISKRSTLSKLLEENINTDGGKTSKIVTRQFTTLFALVKDAKCFEVTYNNKSIEKIPSEVEKILNRSEA